MSTQRYIHPLDPECIVVKDFSNNTLDDPITKESGIADELKEDFERKHIRVCERCQRYGAANIMIG